MRRPREAGADMSRSMRPGGWAQGYDVDATSSVAGAELTWRGRFLPAAESGDAKLFGAAKVKTPNLAPVAVALGVATANGGVFGPADIGFDATLRSDKWTFSKLAATISGVKASGELTYQPVATLAAGPEATPPSPPPRRRLAPGREPGGRHRLRRRRSKASSPSNACRWLAFWRSRLGRLSRQRPERSGQMRNSPRRRCARRQPPSSSRWERST